MHRYTTNNWLLVVLLCLLLTTSSFGTSHVSPRTATDSATRTTGLLPPPLSATEAPSTDLDGSTGGCCWTTTTNAICIAIPRGGGAFFIPAGWNPLGYKITALGEAYLAFDGSLDCDVGRFLASLKSGRKRMTAMKAQWLEVVRVSKSGQTMRVYRQLPKLLDFCVRAGLVD
jgi:hypothetical protein